MARIPYTYRQNIVSNAQLDTEKVLKSTYPIYNIAGMKMKGMDNCVP